LKSAEEFHTLFTILISMVCIWAVSVNSERIIDTSAKNMLVFYSTLITQVICIICKTFDSYTHQLSVKNHFLNIIFHGILFLHSMEYINEFSGLIHEKNQWIPWNQVFSTEKKNMHYVDPSKWPGRAAKPYGSKSAACTLLSAPQAKFLRF